MRHRAPSDAPGTFHPMEAFRALTVILRDPEDTAAGARMVRCLSGRSRDRYYARFERDAMGARILAEGRRLERTLTDRESLDAMPQESLGRCYVEWTRGENISAEGLIEDTRAELLGGRTPTDAEELIDLRGTVSHDLWHVVTGYGRDLLGEAALLHLTRIQVENTGLILPAWLSMLAPNFGAEGRRLIWDARRRARRAVWLPTQDWEALLPEPLTAVRERLRLGAPPPYTPVHSAS
jgi:ubiquinone biosynthesis protein COQ4